VTYHPNFILDRHPAYFDLSIRSTTQSILISAFSEAGVAAGAGEVGKDAQYRDTARDNRDFISLLCEIFSVWSLYAHQFRIPCS